MARRKTFNSLDIDAALARIGERFDQVDWGEFNSNDRARRDEVRSEVIKVREDLIEVAAVGPARAAKVWDDHVPTFVPRPADLPVVEREPLNLNTIEEGRARRRPTSQPFLNPSEAIKRQSSNEQVHPEARQPKPRAAEPEASAQGTDAARLRLLIDGLDRQYLRAEEKYYFRDRAGEVAFEAREKKLVTQHETPSVVSSMIDLAEARGWGSIKLTGTQDFRREAWLQASLRDIDVTGYRPTAVDKAKLDEIRAERASPVVSNTISKHPSTLGGMEIASKFQKGPDDGFPEPKVPLTSAQDQFLRVMEATMRHRGDGPEAIARAREIADKKLTSERVHVGTLIDVGSAPYQDRPGQKDSHFVILQDERGERAKVWGVDLPRALEASGAALGQKVAVVYRGQKPVDVDVGVRNGKGEVFRTERKTVERNSWEVVPFDRLRDEAKASLAKALERQENPGQLRVFDRSAPPQHMSGNQGRGHNRAKTRERSL